ncbi:glycine zipper 2TM domain-containing protein [Sphingobium sp. AR-3-1]|uniref:17 kDa surface antigen n=1 Tax=Sphingobium psychrophilum TaxID=2728834 RepID=A0A7X9WVF3_9SPHN|nr:glycine zipper 2TM domain-containing protein [Sphingobium psychrophilum]NML10563.1 glycine zipper 2TM domain-containing protein [Sphingobium psychrophilum]
MTFSFKQAIAALSLGAMTLTGIAATPAFAQPGQNNRERRDDRRDNRQDQREDRREVRQDRREVRRDVRQDRRDVRRDVRQDRNDLRQDRRVDNGRNDYRRPGRPVYSYDWNRPDPRYGRSYRPDRYYRTGYAPIRVDRRTRIYRGNDNRYYCRRSDGTTGLIVGAALGGLLGNQLAQGQSNILGTLIGGGAGALLGREIDRGGVNCR